MVKTLRQMFKMHKHVHPILGIQITSRGLGIAIWKRYLWIMRPGLED